MANENGTTGTPIANVANATAEQKKPTLDDSELYSVNEETDTVYGQLQKHTASDNPILQREAQRGRDAATRRGLTNSTIASGNAIGKVLDKATEWATTDAGLYERRKNNTVESLTQQDATAKGLEGQKYTADKGLQGDQIRADATVESAGISASAQMMASQAQASATVRSANIRAQESARSDARASADRAADRASNEVMNNLDRESNERMESYKVQAAQFNSFNSDKRQGSLNAHSSFTQGVANIDTNASPASQQTQFDRLSKGYESQLVFIGEMNPDGSSNSKYAGMNAHDRNWWQNHDKLNPENDPNKPYYGG